MATKALNNVSPVAQVVAIGIGIALFFVVGRFLVIPSPVPNTMITLQLAILAVFAVLYGPLAGFIIGLVGHILIDATGYGIWISWELGSAIVGLIIGFALLGNKIREGEFPRPTIIKFIIVSVIANAVAWILVAPLGDILIYSEPANKVFTQGAVAFASNAIVTAVVATLILVIYARTRTKTGSLSIDN